MIYQAVSENLKSIVCDGGYNISAYEKVINKTLTVLPKNTYYNTYWTQHFIIIISFDSMFSSDRYVTYACIILLLYKVHVFTCFRECGQHVGLYLHEHHQHT